MLVPRIKKSVCSDLWSDATPSPSGKSASHTFKIVRLESYEDSLNNLRLRRISGQEGVLNAAGRQWDEYMLGYFLSVEAVGSFSESARG